MSGRGQLYLTLPSNSSMDYYPRNTATNYTTHLPTAVRLAGGGEWEVALVEAHYPFSFTTIGGDTTVYLKVRPPSGDESDDALMHFKVTVSPGNYKDVDELLKVLNEDAQLQLFECTFAYDDKTKRVELISASSNVKRFVLSPALALQLGFDPDRANLIKHRRAARPPNLLAGLPPHMYVYCDLVEPQLVGDTVAPLLKIINIDARSYLYGSHKTVHITDPHYVPVMKSAFESVEIDLRDDKGRPLPFNFGTTCMKLHLRRSSSAAATAAAAT